MLIHRCCGVLLGLTLALSLSACFGNKNQDVVDAPPPPPAAYPDASATLGGGAPYPAGGGAAPSPVPAPAVAATNSAAAAPAPFSLREGEQLVTHQIQPGESLSSIATKYNSSVSRIQSANGLTGTKIIAGKTLQVPTSAPPTTGSMAGSFAPVASTPAPSASPYPASGATYPAPSAAPYPGTTGVPASPVIPPVVTPSSPSYPSAPAAPGAIAAPPVPSNSVAPGYPASTSIPRSQMAPATGAYPTPSFEASRIQFSN